MIKIRQLLNQQTLWRVQEKERQRDTNYNQREEVGVFARPGDLTRNIYIYIPLKMVN